MAVLARVLEATRANLKVMKRLQDLRAGQLEYTPGTWARGKPNMATINSAFQIMSQALDADQSALSIVANNVANANTPGYTREVPNWQENSPVQINGVSYGAGVTETGATSVRDRVLEQRLQQQQQSASASGTRLTALNSLQALFTPDSGSSSATAGDIGSDMTNFFDSFSSLEANPTDNALRQQVLSTASTLSGDVSNTAASLNSQQSALDQEAAGVDQPGERVDGLDCTTEPADTIHVTQQRSRVRSRTSGSRISRSFPSSSASTR